MAGVDDGVEAAAGRQRIHQQLIDFVVFNAASRPKVQRQNGFVEPVPLIALPSPCLPAMAAELEKQAIASARLANEPAHAVDDVGSRRVHNAVGIVFGQHQNLRVVEAVLFQQEGHALGDRITKG